MQKVTNASAEKARRQGILSIIMKLLRPSKKPHSPDIVREANRVVDDYIKDAKEKKSAVFDNCTPFFKKRNKNRYNSSNAVFYCLMFACAAVFVYFVYTSIPLFK